LVVGASSGIGRSFAVAASSAGAEVTVAARRRAELEQLVTELGAGHAVVGDAGDPADARRIADHAAERMGGIDLVLYAAGYGVLQRLQDTVPEQWLDIYRVNVVGANLVTGAVLPHLQPGGVCAYLSSRSVDDVNAMFAPYSASKAALDQCIRTWRVEHPDRRFVRIVMGNSYPTGFGDHMGSAEIITDALVEWQRQGIPGGIMPVDAVGTALMDALRSALDHPEIDSSELKFDARAT
jgi:NAD(P)-dependent dehydrogenase (short-subunit alcohol dehydrogenase family)